MSHLVCVVLTETPIDSTDHAESVIESMLAPFSEHIEVEEYEEECYCVGNIATSDASRQAEEKIGKTVSDLRDEYWAMEEADRPEWDDHMKEYQDIKKEITEAHPLYKKPDCTCDECSGSGISMTTYNPDSQWDWYQVGGRWTGMLSGYEPSKDPSNIETCKLCYGSGGRDDWVSYSTVNGEKVKKFKDDWAEKCNGCNGCKGTGKSVKLPTSWKDHGGDFMPVMNLLAQYDEKEYTPFAFLTPEGEWIQQGKMGWWGMVGDEKKTEDWNKMAKNIYEKYANCMAVVVDCHI